MISGASFAQEVQTEIESNSHRHKISQIVKFLEKIPEYSKNLYLGPLRIYPSFEIAETFDDNVFASSHDKVSDFYTTYKPKILLKLPIATHSINLNYGAEIYEYKRNYTRIINGVRTNILEQNHVNQNFGGSIDLNLQNGLSILLSDQVSRIRRPSRVTRRTNPEVQFLGEPPEEGEEPEVLEQFVFNTPTRRRDFTNNVASVVINLPDFSDKFDFEIHYSNRDISYKTKGFGGSERNTDIFGGTVIIKPLPRINIKTGFDYEIIKYDSAIGNDSTVQRIPFNISWQPTIKSNFFLDTSYNIRDYGRRSIFKNFRGLDATLGYRFDVTERDNLTIKFERSLKEQLFQIDPNNNSVGDNNPYFFTQFNINYIHRFSEYFSFQFSPAFQTLRFREKKIVITNTGTNIFRREKVDLLRFEIKARYDAPRGWLFGEISFNQQDRNSNLSGGGLVKNLAKISVGLSF
ncbi:MAG: outer membrane beta-barrel protein [Candidatus Scalinduaceae bacterium]